MLARKAEMIQSIATFNPYFATSIGSGEDLSLPASHEIPPDPRPETIDAAVVAQNVANCTGHAALLRSNDAGLVFSVADQTVFAAELYGFAAEF
jgi:hypothetical protein